MRQTASSLPRGGRASRRDIYDNSPGSAGGLKPGLRNNDLIKGGKGNRACSIDLRSCDRDGRSYGYTPGKLPDRPEAYKKKRLIARVRSCGRTTDARIEATSLQVERIGIGRARRGQMSDLRTPARHQPSVARGRSGEDLSPGRETLPAAAELPGRGRLWPGGHDIEAERRPARMVDRAGKPLIGVVSQNGFNIRAGRRQDKHNRAGLRRGQNDALRIVKGHYRRPLKLRQVLDG